MTSPARVLIADDHPMFRSGLVALLADEPDLRVVGEAATVREAVASTRELEPDVVVMDLSLPDGDGLEATRRLSSLDLSSRVLVLTCHGADEYLALAVEAGASGYLVKTSPAEELLGALRAVSAGEVYLPPDAARKILTAYPGTGQDRSRLHELNVKEQEVLALTAEGYSSREIGEMFSMSPKTVDTYRSRCMKQLELPSRPDLVHFALDVGLLTAL